MRREELESMMADTDLMDVRNIQHGLDLYRRPRVSTQKRQTESGTIQYPNLTELITTETRHIYGARGTLIGNILRYESNMVSMLHDSYFIVTQNYYQAGRRLSFQQNDRVTVGIGLFYHRTNYTIEEDDSYYYVTCDFDLYIDDRLITGNNRINDGDSYSLIANNAGRRIPQYPERDQQMHDLNTGPWERYDKGRNDTRRYGRQRGKVPCSYIDQEAATAYLKTRQPHMKARAMSGTRVSSAAKSCIAISKTMTSLSTEQTRVLEEANNRLHNVNNSNTVSLTSWFTSSPFTRHLNQSNIGDSAGFMAVASSPEHITDNSNIKGLLNNNKYSFYGNSTHWKKKDNLFLGIKGNSEHFIFARLISTRRNSGDLTSLMKDKMKIREYPETNNLNLLSDNAIVDNYDNSEEVPSEMFGNLSLVRVGDCINIGGGQNLFDYCANIDGVYTLNIQRNIMLRKGTTKMTLYGGRYYVCIPKDTYDIIQYTTLVSQTLEDISVEEIRDRLSFGSTATDLVVESRVRSRTISFGNLEVEEPTYIGSHSRLQLNSLNEEE